jgi:Protein phosphatase 2C
MSCKPWRFAAASAVGTSHTKSGTPCQDSFLCSVVDSAAEEDVLIGIVADGAGSASRSDAGAHLACIALSDVIQLYFALGGQIDGISHETIKQWVIIVQKQLVGLAEKEQAPLRAYACTLLAVVAGPNCAVFLQLGDGAIVVDDDELGWRPVFWPQKGEFANTTNFVTQENAAEYVEFQSVKKTISEIAVFTDGIESLVLHFATKSAYAPYFDKIFLPIRTVRGGGLDDGLSLELAKYLGSAPVCERTDDDKTLMLASRRSIEPSAPQ